MYRRLANVIPKTPKTPPVFVWWIDGAMRGFQRNYFVAAHGAMKPSGEPSSHADSLIREADAPE